MNKIVVIGSKDFNNYELLKRELRLMLSNVDNVQLLTSDLKGTNKLIAQYSIETNTNFLNYGIDWNRFKGRAPYIVNARMLKDAKALIVFTDGFCKVSQNAIDIANKNDIKVHVVHFKSKNNN